MKFCLFSVQSGCVAEIYDGKGGKVWSDESTDFDDAKLKAEEMLSSVGLNSVAKDSFLI